MSGRGSQKDTDRVPYISSGCGRISSRLLDRDIQRWGVGNPNFKGQHDAELGIPVSQ